VNPDSRVKDGMMAIDWSGMRLAKGFSGWDDTLSRYSQFRCTNCRDKFRSGFLRNLGLLVPFEILGETMLAAVVDVMILKSLQKSFCSFALPLLVCARC
jgi:hypothetical protein